MENHTPGKAQFGNSAIAIIYVAVTIFLGITIALNQLANIPFDFFSRDPLTTFNAHPLTGIQSNLGILILVSTAGICLFACVVLRSRKAEAAVIQFFLWSGLITLVLTFDDLFLIHEDLAYRYLEIGQKTILILYVFLIIRYVLKLRKIIPHSDHLLFILALAFFGISEGIDIFESYWNSPWRVFFEDGFKLFGIVSWSIYLIRESFHFVSTS